MDRKQRFVRLGLLALRIAVGSSVAIYIATKLELDFAISAGTITLLTVLATKWETLRLSVFRLLTFIVSVTMCWLIFRYIDHIWIAFGVYIFAMVLFCQWFNWQLTISVNSVIGSHFLSNPQFGMGEIRNEFLLLLIGTSIAIILNFIQPINRQRLKLIENIHEVEGRLQAHLKEIAAYLRQEPFEGESVWDDLEVLDRKLEHSLELAYEFQYNTMKRHTEYYKNYFEMRIKQVMILKGLHSEMKKIQNMPEKHAGIVADYAEFLQEHISEKVVPELQIKKLEEQIRLLREQPLPGTREDFVIQTRLYHVLMDFEEFVFLKKEFVEGMTEEQNKIYWKE